MLAILLNLIYTSDIYMRTKKSLGSALRGFCMLSKGYDRSFINKAWAIRLLVLSFSLPRAGDTFRRGRAHPESICTCSNCSRFDSSLCPTAMLSPWWITGLAYIYQCLKHALLRVGDIFRRGNSYRSLLTSITRKFWDFGSKLSYEIPKEAASVRSHLRKISKKE